MLEVSPPAFAPAGFFVLRTPLFPFTAETPWDRSWLRSRLEAPVAQEALRVASPRAGGAAAVWLEDPGSRREAETALAAYMARASARPTPFGLFAGVSVGRWAPSTALRLAGPEADRRHSRISRTHLDGLVGAVAGDALRRRHLVLRPSSGLYRLDGQARYCEARTADWGRSYVLVSVEPDEHLDATLARAAAGATWAELADALIGGPVTPADADAFVADLVGSGILVPEIAPPVTGPEPAVAMAAAFERCPGLADLAPPLRAAQAALVAADRRPPAAEPDAYGPVLAALACLPGGPAGPASLEADLHRPAEATLGPAVVAELVRAVEVLRRLQPAGDDRLDGFAEELARRYGGREVPLAEALDEESGVGFEGSGAGGAAPLLAGVGTLAGAEDGAEEWRAEHGVLLELLAGALAGGRPELALTGADLARLAPAEAGPLPGAFYAMARVAARSGAAADAGDFRLFLDHVGGPSGARLMGRFLHGDPQLETLVRAYLRAEEALEPEAVLAEIVHVPEGPAAITRPVLRDYEIPFLGRSGAPPDRQIPLSDLTVAVAGGRVVLRSRRLGKVVLPRLTSAHSYSSRSLRLYRFLGLAGHQGLASHLAWDWGPLAAAPFLPRVTTGRTVLARARWRVTAEDLGDLAGWRARAEAPRWVAVADGDQELVVDLESPLSRATARKAAGPGAAGAVLVEVFPPPDELLVNGPDGAFTHEIVVPFLSRPAGGGAAAQPAAPVGRATAKPCRRRFPPGSGWLYAKLYLGEAAADRLISGVLGPWARAARRQDLIDGWFFVREADPDHHVRVRAQGRPGRLTKAVAPALNEAVAGLVDAGTVWRVAFDTYEREVERYGGPDGILLAEQIFSADSDAVARLLESVTGDEGQERRWRLALVGLDRLFDDLGYDLAGKSALAALALARYDGEHGSGPEWRAAMGGRFRRERAALDLMLSSPPPKPFASRSRRTAGPAAALRSLQAEGRLTTGLGEVALSLAHMHAGRMLRPPLRPQEHALYELLARWYRSRAAQAGRELSPGL